VWADKLSTWKAGNPERIMSMSPVRPLYEDTLEWPSLKEIREAHYSLKMTAQIMQNWVYTEDTSYFCRIHLGTK